MSLGGGQTAHEGGDRAQIAAGKVRKAQQSSQVIVYHPYTIVSSLNTHYSSFCLKDSSLRIDTQHSRLVYMSTANYPDSRWAMLMVSFAYCTASCIFQSIYSWLAVLMPQKMPFSKRLSNFDLRQPSWKRSSQALTSIDCKCFSVYYSQRVIDYSFRPRQTNLIPCSPSYRHSRCLLKPRKRSCLQKDQGVRCNFYLRDEANAVGSGMARTCARTLQELALCSHRRVRMFMISGDGKILGLFRGGGGSLAKL